MYWNFFYEISSWCQILKKEFWKNYSNTIMAQIEKSYIAVTVLCYIGSGI